MSPSKQSAFLADTPEASLKREKFKFDAVIEKYIALAHGLPPTPDMSSQLKRNRLPTTLKKKQRISTDKTTKKSKAVAQPLRQSFDNAPRIPPLSVDEEIAQEVEESLLRRKEELGLPADYVCKEVMEYNPKCYGGHHSVRKNTTHNSPTPSKRSKESSKKLRKSDGKMLEDATHSQKRVSQSQTETFKQKKTEEVNELDINVILGSSELKVKKVTKMSEDSNKKLEVIKRKSPNQRAKVRRKDLNVNERQISSDKTKTPRKNTRGKKSSDEKERKNQSTKTESIGKTTAGDTEKEGNAALACDLRLDDKGKPPKVEICFKLLDAVKKAAFAELSNGAQIMHIVQEQNHIFCLFDNLDILHLNLSQENEEVSQTVTHNACTNRTSTSSEHQNGRTQENEEVPQTVRNNACTNRASTSSEHQNGRMPTGEDRKEIENEEQTVRRDTGTTASGQQSVIECANKKRKEAKSELVLRSHPAKEKMSESALQIANEHTLKQKTVKAQEKQKTRLPVNKHKPPGDPEESKQHTDTEKIGIATATSITGAEPAAVQSIVKVKRTTVPVKQIGKTKAIQDEQTNGVHNSLQEKVDTAQNSSRTSNNKIKGTHCNESENMAHGKPQSKASCTKEKRDAQQKQQVNQGNVKKTKVHQSASEVHRNLPRKRKIGVVAKGSDSAKVLESVPISHKSCDISKTFSERRVAKSSMTDSGMEVSDAFSPKNLSHSSADSSYQLTGNGLSKKRKFDYLRFLGSDDDDSDWSTVSHEDDSFEELNVKKKKKKKGSEFFNKKTSKRLHKSSQKVDDDEEIIILKSLWPPHANNENNPNIASTASENNIQTSKPSQKEPSPLKNSTKRTLEQRQRNSFSEKAAKRQVARYQQRKMEVTPAADQSTEEELRFQDTWSLLCPPPVQQSFSYLTSRTRMTSQGSQLRSPSSIRHQASATISRNNSTVTFANSTTAATMVSKPSQSFWEMPNSDDEADDGTLTSSGISKSIRQRSDTTSDSRVTFNGTGLPDYRTLGPERWIAAIKKLQKRKKI